MNYICLIMLFMFVLWTKTNWWIGTKTRGIARASVVLFKIEQSWFCGSRPAPNFSYSWRGRLNDIDHEQNLPKVESICKFMGKYIWYQISLSPPLFFFFFTVSFPKQIMGCSFSCISFSTSFLSVLVLVLILSFLVWFPQSVDNITQFVFINILNKIYARDVRVYTCIDFLKRKFDNIF